MTTHDIFDNLPTEPYARAGLSPETTRQIMAGRKALRAIASGKEAPANDPIESFLRGARDVGTEIPVVGGAARGVWWYFTQGQPALAEAVTQRVRSAVDPTRDHGAREVARRWAEAWESPSDGILDSRWWANLNEAAADITKYRHQREDIFFGEKFIGEVALDPSNLAGWGLAGKLAGTTAKTFTRAGKTDLLTRALRKVDAADQWYIDKTAYPFRLAAGALRRMVPRTVTALQHTARRQVHAAVVSGLGDDFLNNTEGGFGEFLARVVGQTDPTAGEARIRLAYETVAGMQGEGMAKLWAEFESLPAQEGFKLFSETLTKSQKQIARWVANRDAASLARMGEAMPKDLRALWTKEGVERMMPAWVSKVANQFDPAVSRSLWARIARFWDTYPASLLAFQSYGIMNVTEDVFRRLAGGGGGWNTRSVQAMTELTALSGRSLATLPTIPGKMGVRASETRQTVEDLLGLLMEETAPAELAQLREGAEATASDWTVLRTGKAGVDKWTKWLGDAHRTLGNKWGAAQRRAAFMDWTLEGIVKRVSSDRALMDRPEVARLIAHINTAAGLGLDDELATGVMEKAIFSMDTDGASFRAVMAGIRGGDIQQEAAAKVISAAYWLPPDQMKLLLEDVARDGTIAGVNDAVERRMTAMTELMATEPARVSAVITDAAPMVASMPVSTPKDAAAATKHILSLLDLANNLPSLMNEVKAQRIAAIPEYQVAKRRGIAEPMDKAMLELYPAIADAVTVFHNKLREIADLGFGGLTKADISQIEAFSKNGREVYERYITAVEQHFTSRDFRSMPSLERDAFWDEFRDLGRTHFARWEEKRRDIQDLYAQIVNRAEGRTAPTVPVVAPTTPIVAKPSVHAAQPVTQDIDTVLSDIQSKWESAPRNSTLARRDLEKLEKQGVETDEAGDLLQEYQDIARADYDSASEFSEARAEAWDSFVDALRSLEAPEIEDIVEQTATVAAPRGLPAAPVVEEVVEEAAPALPSIVQVARKRATASNEWKAMRADADTLKADLRKVAARQPLSEQQAAKVDAWVKQYAKLLDGLGDSQQLLAAHKGNALLAATVSFKDEFTNYLDRNILDEGMRVLIPFWQYASQAPAWLARTAIQKPGLGKIYMPEGTYWQYTDDGYLPFEMAGMRFNPIQGTVFGRLRRAFKEPYSREYDGWFGGVNQAITMGQRGGLWVHPALNVMTELLSTTTTEGDVSLRDTYRAVVEDLPPVWSVFVEGASALSSHARNQAEELLMRPDREGPYDAEGVLRAIGDPSITEGWLGDRWREYTARLMTAGGNVAWSDLDGATKAAYYRDASMYRLVSTALGLGAYKPLDAKRLQQTIKEKMIAAVNASDPSLQWDSEKWEAWKQAGYNPMSLPADPHLKQLIYDMEAYRITAELGEPLKPASARAIMERTRQVHREADEMRLRAALQSAVLWEARMSGAVTGRDWSEFVVKSSADIGEHYRQAKAKLGGEVLLTPENKEAYRKLLGIETFFASPLEVAKMGYFQIPIPRDSLGGTDYDKLAYERRDYLLMIKRDFGAETYTKLLSELERDQGPEEKQFWTGLTTYMNSYNHPLSDSNRAAFFQWLQSDQRWGRIMVGAVRQAIDESSLAATALEKLEYTSGVDFPTDPRLAIVARAMRDYRDVQRRDPRVETWLRRYR